MGAVYLARQTRPARNVAVKILHPHQTVDDQLYHEFLMRFQREADVIARLEHINIMPIYEYGEQNNIPYLVMPYLTGGSLRDLLAKQGLLSLDEASKYIEQAASALDYAHAHGVVHRDLKPANFLLHADGRLVLADFGIARIIDNNDSAISSLTHTGTIVGTPDYMAPEMAQGEPIDYRVDIYELGIVLFQMLTGHVPFTGSSPYAIVIQHIQKNLPPVHTINPHIPPAIDEVLQKATAKRPVERFATAQELASALHKAIQPIQQTAYYTQPGSRPLPHQQARTSTNINQTTTQRASHSTREGPHRATPPNVLKNRRTNTYYSPTAPTHRAASLMTEEAHRYPPVKKQPAGPSGRWLMVLIIAATVIGGSIITNIIQNIQHQADREDNIRTTATHQANNTSVIVPHGTLLYSTTMPAPEPCNTVDYSWIVFKGNFNCTSGRLHLLGVMGDNELGGLFLQQLPHQQTFPADYVIEAQFQAVTANTFGLYFRDQAGEPPAGAYTFLISPDGSWSVNIYTHGTGVPRHITTGKQPTSPGNAEITLAVIVKRNNFTFYINDKLVGQAQDSTYSSGRVGIYVEHDGEIVADRFDLYTTAP